MSEAPRPRRVPRRTAAHQFVEDGDEEPRRDRRGLHLESRFEERLGALEVAAGAEDEAVELDRVEIARIEGDGLTRALFGFGGVVRAHQEASVVHPHLGVVLGRCHALEMVLLRCAVLERALVLVCESLEQSDDVGLAVGDVGGRRRDRRLGRREEGGVECL